MTISDIEKIIAQGEGISIEFKEAKEKVPKLAPSRAKKAAKSDEIKGTSPDEKGHKLNDVYVADNRVYDKIPTGGTKFNISVRGVVRTGAVVTLIAKRGFHDKETAIKNPLGGLYNRNHTASAVPSGTKYW